MRSSSEWSLFPYCCLTLDFTTLSLGKILLGMLMFVSVLGACIFLTWNLLCQYLEKCVCKTISLTQSTQRYELGDAKDKVWLFKVTRIKCKSDALVKMVSPQQQYFMRCIVCNWCVLPVSVWLPPFPHYQKAYIVARLMSSRCPRPKEMKMKTWIYIITYMSPIKHLLLLYNTHTQLSKAPTARYYLEPWQRNTRARALIKIKVVFYYPGERCLKIHRFFLKVGTFSYMDRQDLRSLFSDTPLWELHRDGLQPHTK